MTMLERIRQPSTPLRSGYAVSIAIGYCLLERDVIQSQCMMYGQRPGCPGGSERRGQKEDAKTGRWEGKAGNDDWKRAAGRRSIELGQLGAGRRVAGGEADRARENANGQKAQMGGERL